MNSVEIEHVSKSFGSHRAVDDLSLIVPQGSVYGFIGPNGSGKTTTLRMIMRIYAPDAGSGAIRVLGRDVHTAATDDVGYLPEERGLYKKMKVRDVLRFYAKLKGVRRPDAEIDVWLDRLGLSEWATKKVEALSKGMAQKIQFIATVLSKPALVILDEPFTGLDPVNAEVLKDAVLDLKGEGATVVFSTHDMSVAERMCDYVFMIHQGRKVLDGTLDEIQDSFGSNTIRLRTEGDDPLPNNLPGVEKINDYGRLRELRLAEGADPQAVLAAVMQRAPVRFFELARPSLHDIFVRIAGPEATEANDA